MGIKMKSIIWVVLLCRCLRNLHVRLASTWPQVNDLAIATSTSLFFLLFKRLIQVPLGYYLDAVEAFTRPIRFSADI